MAQPIRSLALAFALSSPSCVEGAPDRELGDTSETGAAEMGEALTPACHPLYQAFECEPPGACGECPDQTACYPSSGNSVFDCAPGGEYGFGEPCSFSPECERGGLCIPSEVVPGCSAGFGCCTWFCDLSDPSCPTGTACAPYFNGDAPLGFEDVGACAPKG